MYFDKTRYADSHAFLTRMAFDIKDFVALRPFLYHVTARENAAPLADAPVLQPAETLLRWAGRPELIRERRREDTPVTAGVHRLVLKDQKPLVAGNLQLPDGWEFGDLIAFLNRHVFFWPGTAVGPIRQGRRLHAHYEAESPLVVRMRTSALFDANPEGIPLFAAFNTGAPRRQHGQRVARGPDLFVIAADFPRRASEVVEVVFRSQVLLPADAEVSTEAGWKRLATLAA
jgi:hypothetical protein